MWPIFFTCKILSWASKDVQFGLPVLLFQHFSLKKVPARAEIERLGRLVGITMAHCRPIWVFVSCVFFGK